MNLQTIDLGEIIRNHVYVREIYSTNLKDRCLFSSANFLQRLGKLHEYLGVNWRNLDELCVRVKLPDSHNPALRDYWTETSIRRCDHKVSVTKIDIFSRYYSKEVVFASSAWMGEFESFPGDKIIITPQP